MGQYFSKMETLDYHRYGNRNRECALPLTLRSVSDPLHCVPGGAVECSISYRFVAVLSHCPALLVGVEAEAERPSCIKILSAKNVS